MNSSLFPVSRTAAAAFLAGMLAAPVHADTATFSGIEMELLGVASVLQNGDLRLTPPTDGLTGGAWAVTPFSTAESFYSTFTFRIEASDFDPMADGFAFVLQGSGTGTLGGTGGGIGYSGIDGVAAVVHTWDNNRLGLVTTDSPFDAPLAGIDLGSATLITGTQTMTYDPTTTTLAWTAELDVDGVVVTASETLTVDLSARFGESFYAGFTSGTGLSYADHRITSWSLAPIPEPETYALFAAGLGLLAAAMRRRAR